MITVSKTAGIFFIDLELFDLDLDIDFWICLLDCFFFWGGITSLSDSSSSCISGSGDFLDDLVFYRLGVLDGLGVWIGLGVEVVLGLGVGFKDS